MREGGRSGQADKISIACGLTVESEDRRRVGEDGADDAVPISELRYSSELVGAICGGWAFGTPRWPSTSCSTQSVAASFVAYFIGGLRHRLCAGSTLAPHRIYLCA